MISEVEKNVEIWVDTIDQETIRIDEKKKKKKNIRLSWRVVILGTVRSSAATGKSR